MNGYKFMTVSVMVAVTGQIHLTNDLAHATDKSDPKNGLRTITYNVLRCKGYPGQSRKEKKAVGLAIASELSLYKPDIVGFQESPSKTLFAKIATKMGMQDVYFEGGWTGAIITRFKIVESANRPLLESKRPKDPTTRHWGRALLDTGKEKIVFYSAHLMPGRDNEAIRTRKITEMLAVMKKDMTVGRSILFQGDLNHKPDGPEYTRWINAGLLDTVVKGKHRQFTISAFNPTKHIDYIWSYGRIAKRLREYKVLAEGAFVGDPDDPNPFALNDHIPVMATFK